MGFLVDVKRFTNAEVVESEPMSKHTTLHVGGNADYFIKPLWLKDLLTILELCDKYGLKYTIIGLGSNLLVSDSGFRGAIISLENLNTIKKRGGEIIAYSGAKLKDLCKFSIGLNLVGFEGLVDIPASVGGAVFMNAGANGYQIKDYITRVGVIDKFGLKEYSQKECKFGYRKSRFINSNEIIVYALFNFPKGDKDKAIEKIEGFRLKRKSTQPKGFTAGSVFKNPKGNFSALLIEKLNLKGFKIGGAKISFKHANFIVCEKGAKSQDVYSLIKHVQNLVFNTYGILLDSEIRLLGDFNDING